MARPTLVAGEFAVVICQFSTGKVLRAGASMQDPLPYWNSGTQPDPTLRTRDLDELREIVIRVLSQEDLEVGIYHSMDRASLFHEKDKALRFLDELRDQK